MSYISDIFNTRLQNLLVMSGDNIHLKCELAGEYAVVTWKKDDINLLESAQCMISKEGHFHHLNIGPSRVSDTGTYAVEVKSTKSTSFVTVKGILCKNKIHVNFQ